MNIANWKTPFFALWLLSSGMLLSVVMLVLMGSHNVPLLVGLLFGLFVLKTLAVATGAAWFPDRVVQQLGFLDLVKQLVLPKSVDSMVAAIGTPTPPAMAPTVVVKANEAVVSVEDTIVTQPVAPPPGMKSNVGVLVMVALLGISLSACGTCQLPANAAVPKCVLERNLVSCGETDGYALIPIALSVVGSFIAGEFNAAALVSSLEQQGVADVPCVLSALEDYLGISTMAHRDEVKARVHQTLIVALERKNMHGLVTVKLHGGHAVTAVVP